MIVSVRVGATSTIAFERVRVCADDVAAHRIGACEPEYPSPGVAEINPPQPLDVLADASHRARQLQRQPRHAAILRPFERHDRSVAVRQPVASLYLNLEVLEEDAPAIIVDRRRGDE